MESRRYLKDELTSKGNCVQDGFVVYQTGWDNKIVVEPTAPPIPIFNPAMWGDKPLAPGTPIFNPAIFDDKPLILEAPEEIAKRELRLQRIKNSAAKNRPKRRPRR